MKIVHISSVHNSNDPRIRRKELAAVVRGGHSGVFVTGDLSATDGDGVEIVRVEPGNERRALRMLVTSPRCVFRALSLRADVYHLHDPELLPWAWILRLRGATVVYDVHEDYETSVLQKPYLPRWFARLAAGLVGRLEALLSAGFERVIAEKYYARRFPGALPILNYPFVSLLDGPAAFDTDSNVLLYTGNVTEDRGALLMARAVGRDPSLRLKVVGRCDESTARRMLECIGPGAERLEFVGRGRYVPFPEIEEVYARGGFIAGIALFPDTAHYREKELTKFFEYMAKGLPVIASDFPVWKALIEGAGVGLCVDPSEPAALTRALARLRDEPGLAEEMSRAGREQVRSRLSWEREAERLMAFYDSLPGGSE